MKVSSFIFLAFFLPLVTKAQPAGKSFQLFLKQNWRVIRAVDVTDSTQVVYDEAAGIKKWDMNSFSIYQLDKKTYGFINSNKAVETGVPDSVGPDSFLGRIRFADESEGLYEYKQIRLKGNQLHFTYVKWIIGRDGYRLFHYGYHLVCERSKKTLEYPDLATLEKRRGNKINFILTTENGKPLAGQNVKVTIPLKGYSMLTELNTDKEGKATGYYPDSYFINNNNITLFLEWNGLRSSVVLEKKYCPAVLKRKLSVPESEDKIMVSPPDQP